MVRTTQVIMAIGFAASVAAILYTGNELKQQLIVVAKQIDSQPYRIAEEMRLPEFKTPLTRPALQELPPELIHRITTPQN